MDKAAIWERIRLLHPEIKPEHFSFDDPYMFCEIIANNTYHYAPAPGDFVMDIGANVGVFTALCALNGAHVAAYEPHPQAFPVLLDTIKRCGATELVHAYPLAIWTEPGYCTYSPGCMPANTHPGQTWNAYNGNIPPDGQPFTPCITLRDALSNGEWDCVKMDIEGGEFPVLFATPDAYLRQIKFLTLELHNGWATKSRHDALIEKLSKVFDITGVKDGDPRFDGEDRWISVYAKRKA